MRVRHRNTGTGRGSSVPSADYSIVKKTHGRGEVVTPVAKQDVGGVILESMIYTSRSAVNRTKIRIEYLL
jgi:hypothetical protein